MQLLDLITIFIFALGIVIMGLSFSGKGRNMKSFFAAGGAVPWAMSGYLFLWDFSPQELSWYGDLLLIH